MSSIIGAFGLAHVLRRHPVRGMDAATRWFLLGAFTVFPLLPLILGWIAFLIFGPGLATMGSIMVGIILYVVILRLWADRGHRQGQVAEARFANVGEDLAQRIEAAHRLRLTYDPARDH